MPRYFFDVRENGDVVTDEQGIELADMEAAISTARDAAAGIGRDAFSNAAEEVSIDVRSDDGAWVASAVISMTIRRCDK